MRHVWLVKRPITLLKKGQCRVFETKSLGWRFGTSVFCRRVFSPPLCDNVYIFPQEMDSVAAAPMRGPPTAPLLWTSHLSALVGALPSDPAGLTTDYMQFNLTRASLQSGCATVEPILPRFQPHGEEVCAHAPPSVRDFARPSSESGTEDPLLNGCYMHVPPLGSRLWGSCSAVTEGVPALATAEVTTWPVTAQPLAPLLWPPPSLTSLPQQYGYPGIPAAATGGRCALRFPPCSTLPSSR